MSDSRPTQQLAADVREALEVMEEAYKWGLLKEHPTFRVALDALVARITDLEAGPDWKAYYEQRDRAEAAEAQVAALTQERDEALRVEAVMLEREPLRHEYLARAEAAEARAEALQQERDAERRWCKHWAERAEAAEAALATTRQALTDIELATHAGVALNHIGWVARRALAATGGDSKELPRPFGRSREDYPA